MNAINSCAAPQHLVSQVGIGTLVRQRLSADQPPGSSKPEQQSLNNHDSSNMPSSSNRHAAFQQGHASQLAEDGVLQSKQQQQSLQSAVVRLPNSDSTQHRQTAHQQAAESSSAATTSRKVTAQQKPQKLFRPRRVPELPAAKSSTSSAFLDKLASAAHHKQCASFAAELLRPACSPEIQAAAPTYARIMQAQQNEENPVVQVEQQLHMPLTHLLCLWAVKLVLPHPVTQKVLKLSIPDPPDFHYIRTAEERQVQEQSQS